MPEKHAHLVEQLRLACKSSGARWAAWIILSSGASHNPGGGNAHNGGGSSEWDIGPHDGLSKARFKALSDFINFPTRHRWIGGALTSGRPRWQETGEHNKPLGCGRVYLYPCSRSSTDRTHNTILIAGADGLSTQSEAMLRLVGMTPPFSLMTPPNGSDPTGGPAVRVALEQLEALYATSLEITTRLDLNTLLQRIALRARDLAAARGAEVGLLETASEGEGVRVVVSETPWPSMQGIFIPHMTGLAGKIAALSAPLNIANYNEWDGRLLPVGTGAARFAPFRAAAGVPLMLERQVIGTLTVLDDRPEKRFSPEDIHLIEMFGAQAAIAIQNTRLYQELNTRIETQLRTEKRLIRAAQLAAVGDISTQIANEINAPLRRATLLLEIVLKQFPEPAVSTAAGDATQPTLPVGTVAASAATLRDLRLALQQAQQAREMSQRLLLAVRNTQPLPPDEYA
jgi:GAF domain-containing protein